MAFLKLPSSDLIFFKSDSDVLIKTFEGGGENLCSGPCCPGICPGAFLVFSLERFEGEKFSGMFFKKLKF